ncbi:protein methyltransferase [Ostreococcus lucimarinus CCE9901]|uniref:Protein methyltransferase n=1 Tax=Ostreococcus lucimarinus (strain CCE9901) TaxID=436017 RepID=A4RT04_OSTLU|nr:protein methyltransferase [Ostreococcus lucimarinus CCE9901]ABO94448.1 protein methyltransferase [Ostreococcus lucimarinus CCE9901]|eukprot:XP_001416155.1 protein methyltransferase [Ostreococcus lucimarinus CCE9901]
MQCVLLEPFLVGRIAVKRGLAKTKRAKHMKGAHASALCDASDIPIRLVDRPGKYPVNSSQLDDVRKWGQDVAARNIAYFEASNGSPMLKELYQELEWLITDSTAERVECSPRLKVATSGDDGFSASSTTRSAILRQSIPELQQLWMRRIIDRVPLQYLTNTAHWRDMEFTVNTSVLIPRPETELLIDFACEWLRELESNTENHTMNYNLLSGPWLDLGTGSGILAIALAKELQRKCADASSVYAVDVSVAALELARDNARRNGVQDSIKTLHGSWFNPIKKDVRFTGILTNPPYIPTDLLESLQPEVCSHEPWLALDGGGGDGSAHLVTICRDVKNFLLPGGLFAVETHGLEQARLVQHLLNSTEAFRDVHLKADYSGIVRYVTARKVNDPGVMDGAC